MQSGSRYCALRSHRPRRVGPQHARDLGLRAEVDCTSIAPRRARVQRRGRPISEKALAILECNEAFENTELSPWNDLAHQRAPQVGRKQPKTWWQAGLVQRLFRPADLHWPLLISPLPSRFRQNP